VVKITNGINTTITTKSAFDHLYKDMGFVEVKAEEAKIDEFEKLEDAEEKSEDELFVEELLSKPISSWSKNELKRVANIKAIDTSAANNVSEAKEIVKKALSI
jgi:hypothetical protein